MKHGFRVMDSDLHTMEPDGLWERYLEEPFKKFAPRFTRRPDQAPNQPTIQVGERTIAEFAKTAVSRAVGLDLHKRAVARHPHNDLAMAREYDAETHVMAMDIEGIDVGCSTAPAAARCRCTTTSTLRWRPRWPVLTTTGRTTTARSPRPGCGSPPSCPSTTPSWPRRRRAGPCASWAPSPSSATPTRSTGATSTTPSSRCCGTPSRSWGCRSAFIPPGSLRSGTTSPGACSTIPTAACSARWSHATCAWVRCFTRA